MSLQSFFDINMPYGMEKRSDGSWVCFNREYSPLGFNMITAKSGHDFSDSIFTSYQGINNDFINRICNINGSQRNFDENGNITLFWLYNDVTNPQYNNFREMPNYVEKLKLLSGLNIMARYGSKTLKRKLLLEQVFFKYEEGKEIITRTETVIKGGEKKVFETLTNVISDLTKKKMLELADKSTLFQQLVPFNYSLKLSVIFE